MQDTTTIAESGVRTSRMLAYQPALDGVRAISVIAVLLFHADVTGFSGGYLGVSVFFTLSGYLITSLLVVESDRTGSVAVSAFYARRARRLLPASVVCVTGIVVLAAVTDWFVAVSDLRRQIVGSLLQVANWVSLAGEGSYQDLLQQAAGSSSPLEHYWSLGIEEQFYWLWPIAFVGICQVAIGARRRVLVIGALTLLAGIAAPLIAVIWGPDAAYWATPARAAEILIGALLAVVITGRTVPSRWAVAAPLGLIGLTVCVLTFPADGGPAYSGALPLVALASGALLLGLQADGPVRRALSVGPLVWLGRVSYGVYLYHWPVYVILDGPRTDLDGVRLIALRLAVTLVIAQLSFVLVERPIRRAERLTLRPTLIGSLTATAVVVAAAVIVVPGSDSDYWRVSRVIAEDAAIQPASEPLPELIVPETTPSTVATTGATTVATTASAPVPTVASTVVAEPLPGTTVPGRVEPTTTVDVPVDVPVEPPPIPPLSRPVRIVIVGDSTAVATGGGVVQWAADHPELAQAQLDAEPGCGLLRGGVCDPWLEDLPGRMEAIDADVVALLTTSWDVLDRRWDGLEAESPTDPEVAARVRSDFTALTEDLLAGGVGAVAWIREPIPNPYWTDDVQEQEEPERHAVLYATMDGIAERFPDRVYVLDLPAYLARTGLDTDRDARPDGIHWTPEVAKRIAGDYLGEQLIRAALGLEPR